MAKVKHDGNLPDVGKSLARRNYLLYDAPMPVICGIDEAGRGPLAGPVTAGAVVLPLEFDTSILADSKSLSSPKRVSAAAEIVNNSLAWGIGWAWPEEIDAMNIHHATLLAMRRAFFFIHIHVDEALVDGKFTPVLPVRSTAIVKGDSSVFPIMAASILAKVSRDRWMDRYSWIEPEYGFDRNKGYPTREHRRICIERGPSPIHRMSFSIRAPDDPS